MDLSGRRVVVVGLGKSGLAAVRLLRSRGAHVVMNDARGEDSLGSEVYELAKLSEVELVAGGHDDIDWTTPDLCVVSPGVPRLPVLAVAERAGVPVIGEIELAGRFFGDVPIAAVTGSNGKSTTVLLVGALHEASGRRTFVGGNLDIPPASIVPELPGSSLLYDALVLEISSFQAERLPTFRPSRAALLNVSPNHLDRYDDFDDYVRAKGNLFAHQRAGDVAVIPVDDPLCLREVRRGEAEVLTFGPADHDADAYFTADEIVDVRADRRYPRSDLRLAGDHNAANVCASLLLCAHLGLSKDEVRGVLCAFEGLAHRVALVAEIDGVRYYDDSKGTNVGATVAALRGLSEQKAVLIAGGRDKMGSYEPLVEAMRARGRAAVLIGEAASRIAEALGDAAPTARASSMEEAVQMARELARPGDAVLLSPACSSFDMFPNYKERGLAFTRAVKTS